MIVRSSGISLISLGSMVKMKSVPDVFVFLSPCATFMNSFPKAVVQIFIVAGSFANVLWLEMISPTMGCMTGAQKCSISTNPLYCCFVSKLVGVKYVCVLFHTLHVRLFNDDWDIMWNSKKCCWCVGTCAYLWLSWNGCCCCYLRFCWCRDACILCQSWRVLYVLR